MTNDELRESLLSLMEHHKFLYEKYLSEEGHNGDCTNECHTCMVCLHKEFYDTTNKLLVLAQTVIELGESCPKELKGHKYVDYEGSWKDGYNQARADMLLWVAGKLGGLEELLTTAFFECAFFSDEDDVAKISQDIRQLFGVKEEDK